MDRIFQFSFLFTIGVVLFGANSAQSSEIDLNGIFQGKNIYIVNPFTSTGVGFCVFEVTVNGQVTTDEINSSAFEVDLSTHQLKLGDKLEIKIKHKDNCMPKVLNPEVLKPKSTFILSAIEVTKEGVLKWTTTGEAGSLPFQVQQYHWNKWVTVGEVDGKGTEGTNNYTLPVILHSGENKFRVMQRDYTKKPNYSTEATFRSMSPPVSMVSKKVDNELAFTAETMYEVWDYYGNFISKGYAAKVDVSKLEKGKYFINYDNIIDQFTKK